MFYLGCLLVSLPFVAIYFIYAKLIGYKLASLMFLISGLVAGWIFLSIELMYL